VVLEDSVHPRVHQLAEQAIGREQGVPKQDVAALHRIEDLAQQRECSSLPLPSQGPLAAASSAPLPRHSSPTTRHSGKPKPGC
jgi:hypothetical protein